MEGTLPWEGVDPDLDDVGVADGELVDVLRGLRLGGGAIDLVGGDEEAGVRRRGRRCRGRR